jgi:hypothetical protein
VLPVYTKACKQNDETGGGEEEKEAGYKKAGGRRKGIQLRPRIEVVRHSGAGYKVIVLGSCGEVGEDDGR